MKVPRQSAHVARFGGHVVISHVAGLTRPELEAPKKRDARLWVKQRWDIIFDNRQNLPTEVAFLHTHPVDESARRLDTGRYWFYTLNYIRNSKPCLQKVVEPDSCENEIQDIGGNPVKFEIKIGPISVSSSSAIS